jgi:aspartate racemase
MKRIGIVGGAGPLASSLLLKNIVSDCYQRDGGSSEKIPHITLVNYPFDFDACMKSSLEPHSYASSALQETIDVLEYGKVDLLAIACNTLHLFLPYVRIKNAKLVDISHAVLQKALDNKLSKILVLGSPRTMQSELYRQGGISCVLPLDEHQYIVKEVIQRVLAGQVLVDDAKTIRSIIELGERQHLCDGVVLGCTELSVLAQTYPQILSHLCQDRVVVLDTVRILAQTLIQESLS